ASEQSHREGGTAEGDWDGCAIRGKTATVRRLLNTEHVVHRTAESDDPARLRLSLPEDDMSCPLEGTTGRASGIASVLLQFRQTPSGAEIRAGNSDAGHTGRIDRKALDVTDDLRFGNRLSAILQDLARLLCNIILC